MEQIDPSLTEKIFQYFIQIIDVFVWPVVIFASFYLLKTHFAYLFLSIREYSFFGVRGKLRDPILVIEERVKQELEKKEHDSYVVKLEFRLKELDIKNDYLAKTGEVEHRGREEIAKLAREAFDLLHDSNKEISRRGEYIKALEEKVSEGLEEEAMEHLKKEDEGELH